MKHESVKLFTVAEANRTLPKLTELLEKLQKIRDQLELQEAEIDALELIHEPEKGTQTRADLLEKMELYNETVEKFYEWLEKVNEIGCILKDLDQGLVDFYSKHENQIVYLCWKMGESRVGHWHEVGKGYIHRQPINE